MIPEDPSAPEVPARPPDAGRGRLLVVDDDDQVRSLLVKLLRVTGHVVDEASSAEDALPKLKANPPDLILLDMELPGKSGLELVPLIRADPLHRLTPIVMITGAATQDRKVRAIEAGVTEFLGKPFSNVELAARVRALLRFKMHPTTGRNLLGTLGLCDIESSQQSSDDTRPVPASVLTRSSRRSAREGWGRSTVRSGLACQSRNATTVAAIPVASLRSRD